MVMIGEKDHSADLAFDGENSRTKPSRRLLFQQSLGKPDEKMGVFQKGVELLGVKPDGFSSKGSKPGNELTLSYLCENPKLGGIPGKGEYSGKVLENLGHKGKEVVTISENSSHDEKWVERDFLNLNECRATPSKRKSEEEVAEAKKTRLETLNLSLAPPDVSLSLTASNGVKKPKPSMSEKTQTTYSNDFGAASLSYSYSLPFSHNPSCSLTRNSTDNFDCSDQIWCAGEGTNGSVHSRFRPIGDGGVALSSNPSLYKPSTSYSFFPSELAARPRVENVHSSDSRRKDSEKMVSFEGSNDNSRSERILRDIVSESFPVVALMIQELPDETLESAKEFLRKAIQTQDQNDFLSTLQKQLDKRSDLTKESLSKCVKDQLDILVAIRTGLKCFISGKIRVRTNELVEIFLFMRCRNVNCKSVLPVDDCDCKVCSNNRGFCSSCMCPVCHKFDSANNTCSWVGCDVCSHWCHADCGLKKKLIRPGQSLKGPAGTSEMFFCCYSCNHPSEMFGFVKDVFMCCAKSWAPETLIKELDCVRMIFRGSDDAKGKELYHKADEIAMKLETKRISPPEACGYLLQFFNHSDTISEFPASGLTSKDLTVNDANYRKDEGSVTPSTSLPPKYATYNASSSGGRLKGLLVGDLKVEDEDFRRGKPVKMEGFDTLESMVRIKEAEARMFQSKADEATREAESFKRLSQTKLEKMEEEYTEKLARLCLEETEERRRKKLEELKALENSHCDYKNMKLRMEAEIAGLLKRMELTRQQWV